MCVHVKTSWYEVAIRLWCGFQKQNMCKWWSLCIDMHSRHNQSSKTNCIGTKLSNAIAKKLEQTWLVWYPRPVQVVYNNGSNFRDMPLPNSFVYWYLKMFPQLEHTFLCYMGMHAPDDGNCPENITALTNAPNTTRCLASSWWWICHMPQQYLGWDTLSLQYQKKVWATLCFPVICS